MDLINQEVPNYSFKSSSRKQDGLLKATSNFQFTKVQSRNWVVTHNSIQIDVNVAHLFRNGRTKGPPKDLLGRER